MGEESKTENGKSGQKSQPTAGGGTNESGDPGRTPGAAEGDRETVEQDLGEKSDDEES